MRHLLVTITALAALGLAAPGTVHADSPKQAAPEKGVGTAAAAGAVAVPISYPVTPRGDVTDDYFGTKVADPYRWLEADVKSSDSVANWVEAENKVTFAYLNAIPEREHIRQRLTALWNYERYSSPGRNGDYYYFSKNDGLQNQAVIYRTATLNGEPQLVLDPNTFSADGTVALAGMQYTLDGSKLAYGISKSGSDWSEWHFLDLKTLKPLDDVLQYIKFSGADWTLDGTGVFYGRYDKPDSAHAFTSSNLNQKLYYHRLGTPQSEDRLVYERPDHPDWMLGAGVTEDGHYLVMSISSSGPKNLVYYQDLTDPAAKMTPLIDNWEAEYSGIANDGPVFYLTTNLDAPNSKVISIDLNHPEKANWKTVIPEAKEPLSRVSLVHDTFIARYTKDATTVIRLFDKSGQPKGEVRLPGIGTANGFGGKRNDTEVFYSFASFTTPPSIYRYDMLTGESTLLRQAKVDFNPEDFTVEQVFYTSKDGTRVPMFITHRKDLKLDGNNPTLLYGYGGFSISMEPSFSVSRLAWLEMGGVYAVPNIRGGGEYGEEWHNAGTKQKKQNVFDDFIAAGEWLIAHKYTSPARLAVQGGSNGGLLVGAVMTQRPDLFGACLPAVGVMDMLRYHKFTIGRAWAYDYGTSDNADEFKALYAYSPYHNIKPGTKYPATLVTTADTDDRVVPAHSFKFAAALQNAQAGPAPVLIRIETKAGHGGGKPTSKSIEEVADAYAFLVKNLGMTVAQ